MSVVRYNSKIVFLSFSNFNFIPNHSIHIILNFIHSVRTSFFGLFTYFQTMFLFALKSLWIFSAPFQLNCSLFPLTTLFTAIFYSVYKFNKNVTLLWFFLQKSFYYLHFPRVYNLFNIPPKISFQISTRDFTHFCVTFPPPHLFQMASIFSFLASIFHSIVRRLIPLPNTLLI